jgi:hypothetical protein
MNIWQLHRLLIEYHRKLGKKAVLGVVQQYHADLAQRLADEAAQIPRRTAISLGIPLPKFDSGSGPRLLLRTLQALEGKGETMKHGLRHAGFRSICNLYSITMNQAAA